MPNKSILAIESYSLIRQRINLYATKEFRSLGISIRQALILRYLDKHKNVSPTEISENMESHLAAISRALGTLEKKDWVKKTQHAKDNRRWILELTEKGKQKIQSIDQIVENIGEQFIEGLGESEQDQFIALLQKVGGFLDRNNKHHQRQLKQQISLDEH